MGMKRKLARAAAQRNESEKRLASRADRRAEPQRRMEKRAEQQARHDDHQAWLASLTPEQRERYERREREKTERLMAMCAPALLGAVVMAGRR